MRLLLLLPPDEITSSVESADNTESSADFPRIPLVLIYPVVILALLVLILVLRPKLIKSRHNLETRFQESLVAVRSNMGDVLEVTSHQSSASFSASDDLEVSVFGLPISLGETQSTLTVPVVYRFHVLLSDPWKVNSTPTTVIVNAPTIRPTLPPAPDVSLMQIQTSRGWARLNTRQMEEHVRSQVSDKLAQNAYTLTESEFIQAAARKSVELFIEKYAPWLLTETNNRILTVRFPNE